MEIIKILKKVSIYLIIFYILLIIINTIWDNSISLIINLRIFSLFITLSVLFNLLLYVYYNNQKNNNQKIKIKLNHFIGLFIIFSILTAFIILPIIPYISTGIPVNLINGGKIYDKIYPSDSVQTISFFINFKDNILNNRNPMYNFKEGSISNKPLFIGFWGFPLTIIFFILSFVNQVIAYNILIIISFIIGGISAYLLSYLYFKNRLIAIATGVWFTFLPLHIQKLYFGQMYGFLFSIFPLFVYFFEKSYLDKDYRYSIYSSIILLIFSLTEAHLFLYSVVFYIPISMIFKLIEKKVLIADYIKNIKFLSINLFAIIIGVTYNIIVKKILFKNSLVEGGRDLLQISNLSPSFIDIFTKIRFGIEGLDKNIYIGFIPLSIILTSVIIYFLYLRKSDKINYFYDTKIYLFVFLFFISFILSFGTSLSKIFPLYNFLLDHLPYFQFSRTPNRIIILAFTSMIILLSNAINIASKAFNRDYFKKIYIFMIIFLIIIEFYQPNVGISLLNKDSKIETVSTFEKNIESPEKILNLPILHPHHHFNSIYEFLSTKTTIPIINLYSPTASIEYMELYKELVKLNYGIINDEILTNLKILNIKYIIVHKDLFQCNSLEPNEMDLYNEKIDCITNFDKYPYFKKIEKDNLIIYVIDNKNDPPRPKGRGICCEG